ncbi:bifunctional proline dehydrogenase/L-glutamate gamma-semialdehyde dehydrogenase PutA [Shewanella sp. 1_MG-2023]|uniref:bifunctional proline dehydrogenase/L-glutamate gamma-semialdehyde dehydrogenase PutA n=1 Tax=unclassified Shewanella TaxID=196818 RepID=UPI0026E24547|nr:MULTISPECIES: bifunctional proline dehydrogenase/L-glutamate gamma-semialdehyde dehydrogenase PutA [unclassified Shewanella]MDO6611342.1 bifunctional proline dehydrogenase/L-glutamate gamma-semialdehyde dehydrogenase PutA [Shewanella sp. 7_MG-2023]MDO6771197.1 bifunctional proline dehydrogenase/L-glutamate gamma-semialdehyde dehydrogenase PutA [Shewanella sp. 2_MG-2023]MDO6795438.1 bifunctional proline dehydrogenase/L-glutamate gamma-semialdehyde dehydrogenase PutA [Shewanella sp. 1_MG-2023]
MLFEGKLISDCPIRQKIRDFYRIDENIAVDHILPLAEINVSARSKAWERARQMVLKIRQDQSGNGAIDALLNEYSLSSEEGVVLMCLAEALLRVPDKHTQDVLIRDKISQGHWSNHLGSSDSLFVNASSWGLLITGSVVDYADRRTKDRFGLLKKTIGRLGEPVIRKSMNYAMKIMGKQFVMGETIVAATERAATKEQQGYVYSYDMLGEGARTMDDANRYLASYQDAIETIGKVAQASGKNDPRKVPGISVKLSAIHPRYEFTHKSRVMNEIVPKLKALCLQAKKYNIGLTVDAEESERLDISLDVIEAVFSDDDLAGWNGFGIALQAYQKRAIFVVDWLRELTVRVGRRMMVRLVKGAYWDTEIKNAQKDGHNHFPVFTRKSSTDVSFHACANKLLGYRDTIYPQFATHNAYTAATIVELAGDDKEGFEFQCLHGMGDSLYDQIVSGEHIQCRIYAPVGHHEDLLAYLVRRLLENGANSSFVNAIVDESKPVESLLEDPVEKTQRLKEKYNQQILKPIALYYSEDGENRDNSKGLDLTNINEITPLKESLDNWFTNKQLNATDVPEGAVAVKNPANHNEIIGYHHFHDKDAMLAMIDTAQTAFASWSQVSVIERAALLTRIADILERHTDELIALCIKEAGKVAQDGIDEVREAVDFCRYYANRAIELAEDDRIEPRGVVLCISPWNFPLAIFLGQVAAAIATGNTVLAKSAEQTSLIALRAIELMKYVGLPTGVVQAVIAPGSLVGNVILPDERIQTVMFTGSTETGTKISQILSERGGHQVPLIAETGGQNCMIVDSTALPEQVVDDVISSGFQSAGQRCSALRVLFLQEDIADNVITMLKGALAELHVGNPEFLSTDIGPVIDQKALSALNAHSDYMKDYGKLLYQCDISTEVADNEHFFFAPRLYEINDISVLKREVFGPCVHVVRFKGDEIENVIDSINGTGFGLTMGIHTRIEHRAIDLARLSRAGNVYINRNMIGAIVGVQPFGGRGLSGTGPKAGGPNYLSRLVKEKATPNADDFDLLPPQAIEKDCDAQSISEATLLMDRANKVEKQWRLTDLNTRTSCVRQLLAKIAHVDIVDDLADDLNYTLKVSRDQLIDIEKLLKKPKVLPGPTGESNILYLENRGNIICFADENVSFHFWVLSIVTALATGNTVITVVSDLYHDEALVFRDKLIATGADKDIFQVARHRHLPTLLAHPKLSGVVIDGNCDRKHYISEKLAERQGAILPVISSEYFDNLILRLLTEKTVSIDITASGGNTSLMTLVEDD